MLFTLLKSLKSIKIACLLQLDGFLGLFFGGYEQLLGTWTPFSNSMESTLFQPSSGFASGFLIHPLEQNAPTFGTFKEQSPWILL